MSTYGNLMIAMTYKVRAKAAIKTSLLFASGIVIFVSAVALAWKIAH